MIKQIQMDLIENILAIYKVYDGSSSGTENTTYIKVRYGDWFLSENEVFDEQVTISIDVPVFRVYNTDKQVGYNYIQSAIDNASAGDEIILSLGTFNENIVIDKALTLSGAGTGTIITVEQSSGMGSPPIANWNLPGVNVTASDVTIANLLISNFSTGISAFQADDLVLSYVYVEDIEGIGIHIDSSTDVSIGDSSVIRSVSSNIIVEDNSTGVFIQNSVIGWSDESGVIVRKNSDDFEMTNVLLDENEDYGCLLSSNNAIITYSNMHNNGLNGVFVQSVSGASISL